MPAYRPTANCIWRSFRASSKKHLILTGSRGSGKSTLLSALFPQPMPGLTSYVVPEDGVYMKENLSGETVQIGRYQADAPGNTNKMQPVPEAFLTKGIEFLDMCIRHPSDWVTIDETGYLEQTIPAYQKAISRLLAAKHVLLVVRKQKLPFLDSLCKRDDCFLVDLDKPYGDAFCIIMASGKSKRFGANKLLTDFYGKPLIAYAFDATWNRCNKKQSKPLPVPAFRPAARLTGDNRCIAFLRPKCTRYDLADLRSEYCRFPGCFSICLL